jgi:hypothetical protein
MQGGSANNAPSFFQVASFGSPLKAGFTRLFAVKLIYKQQLCGNCRIAMLPSTEHQGGSTFRLADRGSLREAPLSDPI